MASYPTQSYPAGPNPSAQPTISTVPAPRRGVYESYKAKTAVFLGISQIILAIIGLVISAVAIWLQKKRSGRDGFYENLDTYNSHLNKGSGVWASVFFIVSGFLTLSAGKTKGTGLILISLILAVIAIAFAVAMLGMNVLAVKREIDQSYDTKRQVYTFLFVDVNVYNNDDKVSKASALVLLVLAVLELVAATWVCVLYCLVPREDRKSASLNTNIRTMTMMGGLGRAVHSNQRMGYHPGAIGQHPVHPYGGVQPSVHHIGTPHNTHLAGVTHPSHQAAGVPHNTHQAGVTHPSHQAGVPHQSHHTGVSHPSQHTGVPQQSPYPGAVHVAGASW